MLYVLPSQTKEIDELKTTHGFTNGSKGKMKLIQQRNGEIDDTCLSLIDIQQTTACRDYTVMGDETTDSSNKEHWSLYCAVLMMRYKCTKNLSAYINWIKPMPRLLLLCLSFYRPYNSHE